MTHLTAFTLLFAIVIPQHRDYESSDGTYVRRPKRYGDLVAEESREVRHVEARRIFGELPFTADHGGMTL